MIGELATGAAAAAAVMSPCHDSLAINRALPGGVARCSLSPGSGGGTDCGGGCGHASLASVNYLRRYVFVYVITPLNLHGFVIANSLPCPLIHRRKAAPLLYCVLLFNVAVRGLIKRKRAASLGQAAA